MMTFAGKLLFQSASTHIGNSYSASLLFSFANAAEAGIKKALSCGAKSPLLFVQSKRYAETGLVSILGAMKALYVPIEVREQVPEKAQKADRLGVFGDAGAKIELARALEAGRVVSRDIGGSDPERMAAPRVEEYVREAFNGTDVKIDVVKGQSIFEKEYPCFGKYCH